MNNTQFLQLTEMTFSRIKELTNTKGREYSGDEDRCSNFKEEAELNGVDPRVVLMIYMGKHVASVRQYVKDKQQGIERELSEPIEGRLDDMILYCILLKALIRDLEGSYLSSARHTMSAYEDDYSGSVHARVEDRA